MHNYNYIKGPQGRQKITLPVTRGPNALIKDVRIYNDEKQIKGILKAVEQYYRKTPFFEEVYPDFYSTFDVFFGDLDIESLDLGLACFNAIAIIRLCMKFGITTEIKMAPQLSAKKNARIIEMCRYYGADTYLCGSGAAAYIDESEFAANGIALIRSDYTPPVYPQRYGDFVPNLSVLDWIFNMGFTLPEGWLSWKK